MGGARSAGKGKRIGGLVKWYSLIRRIVAEHFSLAHESLLSIFTIEHCRFWYVFEPISLIHWSKQPHVKPHVGPYYCCGLFGRIFTLNLTITTFYLAMAMLVGPSEFARWIWRSDSLGSDSSAALQALVLVPGTNLAFRQTARNPDGSLAFLILDRTGNSGGQPLRFDVLTSISQQRLATPITDEEAMH